MSSVPSNKFLKFYQHTSLTLIGTAKQIKLLNKNKENFLDTANKVATEDSPSLVEAARTFPGLEGVESGGDDEQEGEEEPHHKGAVHP